MDGFDITPAQLAGLDREMADAKNELRLTVEAVRRQLLVDEGADSTLMEIYLIREFYRVDHTKLTVLLVQALLKMAEAA